MGTAEQIEDAEAESRAATERRAIEAVLGAEGLARHEAELRERERSFEDLVYLPNGWISRRRFTRACLVPLPDRSPVMARATILVGEDNVPRVRMLMVHLIDQEDLTDEQLSWVWVGPPSDDGQPRQRLLDRLMAAEMEEITRLLAERRGVPDMSVLDEIIGRDRSEALAQAKRLRRRHSTTPDRLRDVLALYDEGGQKIKAVADGLSVSESQAYKLLAKARKQEGAS
jgi:hypothetical protein